MRGLLSTPRRRSSGRAALSASPQPLPGGSSSGSLAPSTTTTTPRFRSGSPSMPLLPSSSRPSEQWDDSDETHLKQTSYAPTLGLKVGAALTSLLAFALFVMMSYALKAYLSPDADIQWKTFALHPLLMTLAFGLLSPVGVVSWRTYEHIFGLSHGTVKAIHVLLMVAAAVIGVVGVCDMWLVHEAGAAAQLAKGWAVHFQSLHSWLGALSLGAFVMQAGSGLLAFFNPAVSSASRKAYMPVHIFVGCFAVFGTLLSIITGILSLAYRGDNAAPKDLLFKVIGSLTFLLCAAVALVFASPKPQ